MPVRYDIVHTTVYRYKEPVTFGEHRVMFRPRDSHDLRVLATDLEVSPEAIVRMIQDPVTTICGGRSGCSPGSKWVRWRSVQGRLRPRSPSPRPSPESLVRIPACRSSSRLPNRSKLLRTCWPGALTSALLRLWGLKVTPVSRLNPCHRCASILPAGLGTL